MYVYTVVQECWDGIECSGTDLYMSLDQFRAEGYMNDQARANKYANYTWTGDMWFSGDRDVWNKLYVIATPLDEEL